MTLSIQNRVEVMVAGSWEEGLVWGEAPGRARQVAVGEKKKKGGGGETHPPQAHTQRGRAKGHSDHQAIRLTYKP